MMEGSKVFPKTPVDAQVVKLSVQDAYSPKVWVTQTHFWPLDDSRSFEKSYEALREGLSRLISEFPGLLGKIAHRSDDPRDLQIVVDEDAGVEFSHEDISGTDGTLDYQTYKAQGFPMTHLATATAPKVTQAPVTEGAPMFAAKLNKLSGGMALAFGFNHVYTDASAVSELERIWALHTADASAGREQKHKVEVDSQAIRDRISTPVSGASEFIAGHFARFPTEKSQLNLPREPVSAEAALAMLEANKKAHLEANNGNIKVLKWCVYHFSPESLAKLKQDAHGPNDSDKWVSTMDALIGLCWSRIALFKKKSSEGLDLSTVAFPVNIRSRLDPPISANYIGNLIDIVVGSCRLSELESPETGVAAAARGLRAGVEAWSQKNWEAWLTLICSLGPDEAVCPNPVLMLAPQNLAFNDYSKSQSNVLDWGDVLGRIDRTRYFRPAASLIGCGTAVIVHPRLAEGGLEVAITCDEDMQAALEKDDVFQRYTTLIAAYE